MINMIFQPKNLSEYQQAPLEERIRYLHTLTEASGLKSRMSFVVQALNSEAHPLAKWYLIKEAGLQRENSAVCFLIALGKEKDVEINNTSLHRIAAWSLGQIGISAIRPVLDAVKTAANDDELTFLVDVLGELKNPLAIPALTQAFLLGGDEVRLWAALSLAKIGPLATNALENLLQKASSFRDKMLIEDALAKMRQEVHHKLNC